MLRSVGAVLLGFFLFSGWIGASTTFLQWLAPDRFGMDTLVPDEPVAFVVIQACVGLGAAIGGQLAARIARRRPTWHALALGLLAYAALLFDQWGQVPVWYSAFLLPLIISPAAWASGRKVERGTGGMGTWSDYPGLAWMMLATVCLLVYKRTDEFGLGEPAQIGFLLAGMLTAVIGAQFAAHAYRKAIRAGSAARAKGIEALQAVVFIGAAAVWLVWIREFARPQLTSWFFLGVVWTGYLLNLRLSRQVDVSPS